MRIPFALAPIGQLHQSPPSLVPGDPPCRARRLRGYSPSAYRVRNTDPISRRSCGFKAEIQVGVVESTVFLLVHGSGHSSDVVNGSGNSSDVV